MLSSIEKVSSIVGEFTGLPKYVPTNGEPDGALCGNGDIGVTASANLQKGTLDFYMAKNDLWYTDTSADRIVGDRPGMRALGILSFGSERLSGTAADFRAKQFISNATIVGSLVSDKLALDVSCTVLRKSNIILYRVTAKKGNIPLSITFSPTYRAGDQVHNSCNYCDNKITVSKEFKGGAGSSFKFHVAARADITVINRDRTSFTINEGETVTVAAPFYTNIDSEDYIKLCERDSNITAESLKALEAAHTEWWNEFWSRSGISIPSEPEIERHWYASHYLMACCCENGKFPPGIFGNWITNDNPNWGADYHMNYNYQAPWWGCYSSNQIELSEVYDQPLLDYVPQAKEAARKKLDCNGIYLLVGIGPRGLRTANIHTPDGNDDPNYWGQKSNAAYTAINMLMRFYSTYDEKYASQTALPYLLLIADFWEDYLKFEDGRYVIYNDCIHENGAVAKGVFDWVDENTPDYSDDFNPILTLGLLRNLFKGLIDMSETLDTCKERREKWRHILEHMSDFPLQERNGKTVFRYTERGMDWCDGNSLGIQHIFPAGAIGLSSPPELLKIAENTFEEMARWEDYNAFPTFYTAGARIGYKPEVILEKMNAEIKKHGFPNFFIYYGGGGIECCSAIPSCINEMLLQSHEGVLRFFPTWCRTKDAAFDKLRSYGAFLITASLKSGEVGEIELVSEKGRDCVIESPWESGLEVLCGGTPVDTQKSGSCYSFKTVSGGVYTIRKRAVV